jgi:hypothetical protein
MKMEATMEMTDTVKAFKDFEKENGPSFVWGHINSPYSGCFFLNGLAFMSDHHAFVAADLNRMERYKRYVVTPPHKPVTIQHECKPFAKVEELSAGCIMAEDIDNVLSGHGHAGLEFHPISELGENTPYALFKHVNIIATALGYDVKGQFKCAACGGDFAAGEETFYLESEFKGNGGIGIEVGAPICEECYCDRRCGYCGNECEPYQNCVDEDGHCVCCAEKIVCPVSGQEISLEWDSSEEAVAAYRQGISEDGLKALEYAKAYEDKATGSLFKKSRKKK